jgi:tRNA threonylcarbamoyl adenosine modification protein (Sua5/YciO/YrdC/YwlC family)
MAQYFQVHPSNPQERLLKQASQLLAKGGVLAVPTDSSYALVCQIDDTQAVQAMRRVKGIDEKHLLSLMCPDLATLSNYAKVDNKQFRLLKSATPGPFTFILEATKEVPKRVSHPQRKTIGLRVPDHVSLQMLIAIHGSALLGTTLVLGEQGALNDPEEIRTQLEHQIAGVIDAGPTPMTQTTVLDLTPMNHGLDPVLIRQGAGSLSILGISVAEN